MGLVVHTVQHQNDRWRVYVNMSEIHLHLLNESTLYSRVSVIKLLVIIIMKQVNIILAVVIT